MGQTYEVNVLGDVADLFAEMGSKLLRSAFKSTPSTYITAYNYVQSAANVISSQDLTNNICQNPAAIDSGTVIIPLADHGLRSDQQPLVAQSGYGLMGSEVGATALTAPMLKPAIRLREVIERVLLSNGFFYTSDFFDSAYFDTIYMTLGDHVDRVPTSPAGQCKAVIQSGSNPFTNAIEGVWTKVPFNSVTLYGGFDNDGLFNTVPDEYQCGEAGTHSFSAKVRFRLLFAGAGESVDIIARITRGNISIGSTTLTLTTDENDITVEWSTSAVCAVGESITVEFRIQPGQLQAGTEVNILGAGITAEEFAYSQFLCTSAPGGVVNIPQALPRIKQKEFFSDLAQRFNLVIEADPDNPKQLYIEPYAAWIADGLDAYWTDKLDLDKERTLKPTSSIKSSLINLTDKESGDVGNVERMATLGRVFGAYTQEIDDEFAAVGELKNTPVFAPFFVYQVPTLQGDPITELPNVLIHRSYEIDGVGVRPKTQPPKLFHATGLQDTQATLYVSGSSLTQYQLCSPYEDSPANSESRHLFWNNTDRTFSANNPLIAGNPPGLGGYHRTYWSSYLSDIYDRDARIFEAYLYLTPSDIRNVRFNDRFHILGATYKLTEISNYQIGTGEPTLCKFLRDLSRSSFGECSSIPTQSNANGTVTFTDADGTTTNNPGLECCEAFGYFYDEETNTCRWQNPDIDDGDAGPPDTPTDAQDPEPYLNGDNPGPVSPTGTNTNTTDPDSGTVSVYDEVILTGETTDDGQVTPSAPNGVPIQVADNTVAVGVVRITSVTVGGSSGVPYTTKFETWRFLANGNAETVTVSETSGTELDYGSPGLRRLTASMADGILSFQVAGEADEIINWTLSVEMVRMYATNISSAANAILTERGANLTTEGGNILIQE
jgi:hypothetical protein